MNQEKIRGNEVKFTGPDGVTIDLSEHGWLGTSDHPPAARRSHPLFYGA